MATAFWGFWHSAALSPSTTQRDSQKATRDWQQFVNQLEPELMQSGDVGNRVKTLQLALQALSVYGGMIDGRFGPQTEVALRHLQETLGVERNGVFDQSTWYALSFWTPCAI